MIDIRPNRGILILDHHGFGNVVMSLPFIQALSRWAKGRWPVRILLNTRAHYELLQEEGLDISPVFYRPDFEGFFGPMRLMRRLRATTDLVVAVPQVPFNKLAAVRFLIGARFAAGEAPRSCLKFLDASIERSETRSVLKSQEELLDALGIACAAKVPSITLSASERSFAQRALEENGLARTALRVGLHCSSQVESKRWLPRHFGDVLGGLRARFENLGVVSFGSGEDRSAAERVRQAAGDIPWLEGAGVWNIRQTLAMLSQCKLSISGDTGVMHMAAAVGVKTLGIFGPSSPKRFFPYYSGGAAVAPERPCHPCYRSSYRSCSCIDSILPDRVLRAAESLLTKA